MTRETGRDSLSRRYLDIFRAVSTHVPDELVSQMVETGLQVFLE